MKDNRVNRMLWSCNCILRLSSWIVPRKQSKDWLREWQGEVWHWVRFLDESGRINENTSGELLQHCWGSLADALWHRFNREKVLSFVHRSPLSPEFCIFTLLLALSVLGGGGTVARLRSIHSYFQDDQPSPILTVSLNADSHWVKPEILRDVAKGWPGRMPLIAEAAAYAWRPAVGRGPAGRQTMLAARVTAELFALLGKKPMLGHEFEATDSSCPNCVILTDSIWKDQFGRSSNIIGSSLVLDGREMTIVGVLPPDFQLPGVDIGVYVPFGNETNPSFLSFEEPGALVRLIDGVNPSAAKKGIQSYVSSTGRLGPHVVLDVLSIKDLRFRNWRHYGALFGIGLLTLSCFSLPSLLRLGVTAPGGRLGRSFKWWGFFVLKNALLVLIVCTASEDLVHAAVTRLGVSARDYERAALIWMSCVGSTMALVWSIRDQFGRCRSCLRRLSTQMVLGTSAGFLSGPSGTEFLCEGGHGSLHLPVIFHSCVDSRYWTELDNSWRALTGGESMAPIS